MIFRKLSKAQHEITEAFLILAACIFVFISPALVQKEYYAPSDIIRNLSIFSNGSKPHNFLLSDPFLLFMPWFKLSKELIRSGHFPLWNIYSGGGVPLFANMVSAILYPPSFFFYFFDFRYALIASSFFKLLFIGLFTYLYFKEIKLTHKIAIAGAIAFMFSGFNIVWLMWPQTNVMYLMPCGLYLIEKYFSTKQSKFLLWFSLALAIGIFAGHPETFFHIVAILGLYILYKLFYAKNTFKNTFTHIVRFFLFGTLGGGLSALLIIPFFEYLKYSEVLAERNSTANEFCLRKSLFILNYIPDFFGNQSFKGIYFNPFSNYNESTSGYVGITLFFLALYSALFYFKDNLIKFYAFLIIFCSAIVYKAPVLFSFITRIPGFRYNANHRLLFVIAFAITAIGALGLQKLSEYQWPNKRLFIAILIFISLTAILIFQNISITKIAVKPTEWPVILHRQFWIVLISAGNFIISLWIIFKIPAKFKPLLLAILIFLETGIHGIAYNSITKDEDFYPANEVVNYLQSQFPQGFYKTFSYFNAIPPNLGTWYGFNQINDYDGVGLLSSQKLKQSIGPYKTKLEIYDQWINFNMLKFLNVKYLVFPKNKSIDLLQTMPNQFHVVLENEKAIILEQEALPRAYIMDVPDHSRLETLLQELMRNPSRPEALPVKSFQLEQNGTEHIEYDITRPGFLVLNENYYPGWIALLDNKRIGIQSASGLRALQVPAGNHKVTISYNPKSFKLGILLSLSSLAIWFILIVSAVFKKTPITN